MEIISITINQTQQSKANEGGAVDRELPWIVNKKRPKSIPTKRQKSKASIFPLSSSAFRSFPTSITESFEI
jgi:hypothetical protein